MRIDNGFTFAGEHSQKRWGLICVKGKSRTVSPSGQVYSYEVGGLNGSLAYNDQRKLAAYDVQLTLYAERELPDETTAQRLWVQVRRWLMQGRRALIWDAEPERVYTAECTKIEAKSDGEKGLPDEYLVITIRVQPESRSAEPWVLRFEVASSATVADLYHETQLPAPLNIAIKNTGTKAIKTLTVACGGRAVQFTGMTMAAGAVLDISMETPIGAMMTKADGTVINALPYAAMFQRLTAETGDTVSVLATYESGEGTGSASVRCELRGVWA